MSPSEPFQLPDPFNQYNTELVKLDASGCFEEDLIRGQLLRNQDLRPLALLMSDEWEPDYEIPADSVNNKSFTDVTFIVGPAQHSKKYVGHRVLLAMTSPVFETMFYGDMADKSKYIRISDVAPIGFENLLRFAYTDTLNLKSVEDAMLTAYAAKKYLLPQLLRDCLLYIEQNISPSTACVVFEFAQVLNSQQLVLQAMQLIDRQTELVLSRKSFQLCQPATVEFIANRKYLTLDSEFALASAIVAWTKCELSRRKNSMPSAADGSEAIADTGDLWLRARRLLNEETCTLPGIKFLAMTSSEFARFVQMTSQETADAETGHTAEDKHGMDTSNSNRPDSHAPVELANPNSLLNGLEQRALLMNLALESSAQMPDTLNREPGTPRRSPPEHFVALRAPKAPYNVSSTILTSARAISTISSKFQCLNENIFIIGLTIPIRLDASSYLSRTPKFECHLKFTTTTTASSSDTPLAAGNRNPLASLGPSGNPQLNNNPTNTNGINNNNTNGQVINEAPPAALTTTTLMDTLDESLHISISKERDCLVRLKRPILIRMANMNELSLTFQTYALDEDVALRTPKMRLSNFSEQTDQENISWLFIKTSTIEFSEIHYYY